MPRSRALAAAAVLAISIGVMPLAAPVALAADPTITVQPGDTLTSIAERTGVTIAQLVEANGIDDPDLIRAGQLLRLPGSAGYAPAVPASTAAVHLVVSGESLWGIARHYGTTVAAIVAANGIANPSFIVRGQRIIIPGSTAPSTPRVGSSKPVPASLAAAMGARDAIRRLIVAEAGAQGVPVAFALAVAWQESGWQAGVVSHAGAVGVMQLLPTTADWVSAAMLGGAPVNLWDARSNIRAGVALLAYYLDRYDGSRDLALAAYYQGMTAVDRHGIYPVSRPYIASIRALESVLGG